jgi:hypothetical protein
LYNFYTAWKDEWGKKLTIPDENRQDVEMNTGGAPSNNPPQPPAGNNQAGATTGTAMSNPSMGLGGSNGLAVNENKRSKKTIIDENRERMMKLAKLWI